MCDLFLSNWHWASTSFTRRALFIVVISLLQRVREFCWLEIDLYPGNIMFSTTGLTESEITSQLRVAMFCPVRWRGGVHVDDSAPEFLITPQMPSSKLRDKVLLAPKVMIGDLGQGRCFHFQYCLFVFLYWRIIPATWKEKYDKPIATPIPFRAPELINKSPWDASVDIWALGCLVSRNLHQTYSLI